MSDAPRKAPKRWIVLPYVLAALLAAGWSLYWLSGKTRIEKGLEDQTAALKAQGYDVAWSSAKVSGYPFRFYVTMKAARIAEPGGWGVSAPYLEAEAAAYQPGLVVLSAPQGITLARPSGTSLRITGQALRMSIGGYARTPPRLSIQGVKVAVTPLAGAPVPILSAIDTFEAHLAPAEGDTARLSVRFDKATVTAGNLAQIAGGTPVTFAIEGTASRASALSGKSWPDLVRRWAAAGGVFEVHKGGLSAGQAELSLKSGSITADPDGRLNGKAHLALTRPADDMMALGAIGVLPSDTAAVGAGLAAIGGASASLHFHDGKTWLGPLPLGSAPRLY
jgi:hypothetical protein